jgi:HD-like signal output (HDOD) protein
MADLDRYFERQDALAAARTVECPVCHAEAAQRCADRWGLPTSMVHAERHQDDYSDPYPL